MNINFPNVDTILHAHPMRVENEYSIAAAEAYKPLNPAFIPTNNPALNAVIAALGVKVQTDVPNIETNRDGSYAGREDFPYTNNNTHVIHMPHPLAFKSEDVYAHVLAHELGHFTMNAMDRPIKNGFTVWDQMLTNKYGDEELVAEMTAMAFETMTLGRLATEQSSLGYLQSFLTEDKEAPDAYAKARNAEQRWQWATQEAEKAATYLLSFIK